MSTSRSSPPPPAPGTARLSALPPGESGRPPPRRPPPHPPMRASAPRGRARRARGDGRVPNLGIYRIIRRISRAGGGLMARQEGGGGESLPMDGGGREWQSAVRGGQLVVVEAWDQCGWGGGNEPRIHRFRPRQFRQPGKRAGRHPLGGGRGGRSANKPRSAHGPATTESPPTDGRGPGHTRGMNTGLRCDCTTHINWQARRPSLRKAQRSKGGAGGVVVAIHFSG